MAPSSWLNLAYVVASFSVVELGEIQEPHSVDGNGVNGLDAQWGEGSEDRSGDDAQMFDCRRNSSSGTH